MSLVEQYLLSCVFPFFTNKEMLSSFPSIQYIYLCSSFAERLQAVGYAMVSKTKNAHAQMPYIQILIHKPFFELYLQW